MILDSFFDNVCELDLVFNFYKVRRQDLSIVLSKIPLELGVCNLG